MSTDKEAHIVSIGLEQRRNSTYIPKIGANKVVVVYFKMEEEPTEEEYVGVFKKSLLERLEDNRKAFRERMESIGIEVAEVSLGSFDIKEICPRIYCIIEQLKNDGFKKVHVNLSTGHTTYKIAAYIVSCYDPRVKVWYGFTHDYLDDKINALMEKYSEWIYSAKDEVPEGLKDDLKDISDFTKDGHTGMTTEIVSIPPIPMPKLEEAERWIMKFLYQNDGSASSIKYVAKQILESRPKCFHRYLKMKSKDRARTIAQQLGKKEIKNLVKKGYINKEKEGTRKAIIINDAGMVVVEFVMGLNK